MVENVAYNAHEVLICTNVQGIRNVGKNIYLKLHITGELR
jgi:hypothetical protein